MAIRWRMRLWRTGCLTLLLLGSLGLGARPSVLSKVAVAFHADTLELEFDPEALPLPSMPCKPGSLKRWYESMRQTNWRPLHTSLQAQRKAYRLNDWLTYRLLQKTLQALLPHNSEAIPYFCWFYLGQAGLDPRLGCRDGVPRLYVYTRETIYGRSFLSLDPQREYINLHPPQTGGWIEDSLTIHGLSPWPPGRSFSFALDQLPLFRPVPLTHRVRYVYRGDTLDLRFQVDSTLVALMDSYPQLSEQNYLHVPLSSLSRRSLVQALKRQIQGMSTTEAVRRLVAFTRTGFIYREDEELFGVHRPLIAEETLVSPASDCEDRCALLYQLVSELLDLPMIIIAYPRHLTLGLALPQAAGEAITYRGVSYYVCDPTGPAGSEALGELPERFAEQPFSILGQ